MSAGGDAEFLPSGLDVRLRTPEQIRALQVRRTERRLRETIRPLQRALEKDGSSGVALLEGASQERVVKALAAYTGEESNVRRLPAESNVQGNACTDAEAVRTIQRLEAFREVHGSTGIIVLESLRPITYSGEKGHPDVWNYLEGIALESRRFPNEPRINPMLVGLGPVRRGERALLESAADGRGRHLGEGFNHLLNDHFMVNAEGRLIYVEKILE